MRLALLLFTVICSTKSAEAYTFKDEASVPIGSELRVRVLEATKNTQTSFPAGSLCTAYPGNSAIIQFAKSEGLLPERIALIYKTSVASVAGEYCPNNALVFTDAVIVERWYNDAVKSTEKSFVDDLEKFKRNLREK